MSSTSSPTILAPATTQLVSNGSLTSMLRNSGTGFIRWRDLAVSRWREDPTCDPWGSFMLLRDEESGQVWSPTAQPLGDVDPLDERSFVPGRASFSNLRHDLHSALDVAVAPDADVELRRLTVSNRGEQARKLSLTTYVELVLGPAGDDRAHPAFSKMFVQTEWDGQVGALLATRRRRSDSQPEVWAAQTLQVRGHEASVTYETDRVRFLGRGRTLRTAAAMQPGASLSNTVGCVLDPVFSLRHAFTLAPGASIELLLWTQVGDSREIAESLDARLQDPEAMTQLLADATNDAEVGLQQSGITPELATQFAHWLSALLISDSDQRASATQRARGHGGPPTLWGASISGDRPIALIYVERRADVTQLDTLLAAQRWWRADGVAVDVVVLDRLGQNGEATRSALQQRVDEQKKQLDAGEARKAELFCLRDDQIDDTLRDGLLTVARLLLGVPEQNAAPAPTHDAAPKAPLQATKPAHSDASEDEALEFRNGYGGFSDGGRSYRIELDAAQPTPAPWTNVMSNATFGCIVTAEGGGYT